MSTSYKYAPFLPGNEQIRLLTLLPASEQNGGEIVITLKNSSTEAAARQYEALSYVWGSSDNTETVSVATSSPTGAEEKDVYNSTCDAVPLLVTQNLAIALRHLRRRDAPRKLWIDAICIDQQNKAERSEQVGKMGQIYSSSTRVLIWLGPASPDSDPAMRLVGHLGQVFDFDFSAGELKSTSYGRSELHWYDIAQPLPYVEAELCALEKLFWRPWFERLWVVQEVLMSPEAVVICGMLETTWQSIMVAGFLLARKDTKTRLSDGFVSRLLRIGSAFDTSVNRSLLNLVYHTRGLKCADDRDRIYAMLSLANDAGKIKPDYSLSTVQVYEQLAMLSMSNCQLGFLSDCELGSRRLAGPSWIPDWTADRTTTRIRTFNGAMIAQQPVIERPAGGCVQVAAVRVGTVAAIDIVSIPSRTSSLILREIVRLVPADVESSTYKTGCPLLEAFSGTLTCSGLTRQVPQTPDSLTLQKCMKALRACLRWGNNSMFENTLDNRRYLGQVYSHTKNRALVRTEEGYIGLAPSDVKHGDTILAILSCASFTVVRPAPGDEGRYNVVGESMLYGLSNGEAVLGPVPEHIRVEYHYQPRVRGFFDAYRDTRTDSISHIDPRLEALGIPYEPEADGVSLADCGDALEKVGIRLSKIELV